MLEARIEAIGRCWLRDENEDGLPIVQLETESLSISRNRFIELMCESGIGTSVHFIPLHLHPYWQSEYGLSPLDYPVAHDVYKRSVSLPIYPKMSEADVDRVIGNVERILCEHWVGAP